MLRTSHALLAVFLCCLVTQSVVSVRSEGQPPQGRGRGQATTLPDGPGKEMVQTKCAACHGLNLIANWGGDTKPGWQTLFGTMVSLPKDQSDTIAGYLTTAFPDQPRPKPMLIPGPVTVSFKEWVVPSLGSRPHDPEPGPGGTIWWTGMFANVLGRVDPKTGR